MARHSYNREDGRPKLTLIKGGNQPRTRISWVGVTTLLVCITILLKLFGII